MKEIVIKVKDDIYEKARNEYYGENEVSASMVNEIFSAVFHSIPSVNPQEPSGDAISRKAVEDKLLKLCNEIEVIFANIRMQNVDESVCGLCEYDCPAPFVCKGYYTDECFKLADEIRHKWQSTNDLPSVNPQKSVLDDIRAEIKELPYQRIFGSVSSYSLLDTVIEIIDKHISGEEQESEG